MTETVVHRLRQPWCDNKDDDDSGQECYAGIGVELSMYKPEQYTTGDNPGRGTPPSSAKCAMSPITWISGCPGTVRS